jgi:hypothetical protein
MNDKLKLANEILNDILLAQARNKQTSFYTSTISATIISGTFNNDFMSGQITNGTTIGEIDSARSYYRKDNYCENNK